MGDATSIYGIEARASSVTRLSVHTPPAFNSPSPGRSRVGGTVAATRNIEALCVRCVDAESNTETLEWRWARLIRSPITVRVILPGWVTL
jgi:hypothetical protein